MLLPSALPGDPHFIVISLHAKTLRQGLLGQNTAMSFPEIKKIKLACSSEATCTASHCNNLLFWISQNRRTSVCYVCRPEAMNMDPQQRLLLEQTYEVLSSSPNKADTIINTATAVVVGIGTVEYNSISSHLGVGIYVATGDSDFSNYFQQLLWKKLK